MAKYETKTRYKSTAERKTVRVMIRLSNKNAFYLSKLGYIDLRSGRAKNNCSNFINSALTSVCESRSAGGVSFATSRELLEAWVRTLIGEKNAQMDSLRAEVVALARKVSEIQADSVEIMPE